ncbi:MAG: hypothetical protein FJW96_14045 [Actinobacteria bacterium]|nr:hypothetical protein [Actinomycetota bacterium]
MEPFPDLSTLSDDQLSALIAEREAEEDRISYRRRVLHGRIDILRGELVARIRARVEEGTIETVTGEPHERPIFEGTGEVPEEHDLEPLDDLHTISTQDLRDMIHELEREEDDVSLHRRFLHGQIDILRAERSRRARGEHVGTTDLAGILGRPGRADEGA